MKNPVSADGDLTEWPEMEWRVVQQMRISSGFSGRDVDYTRAALAYDDQILYIGILVGLKGRRLDDKPRSGQPGATLVKN